VATGRYERIYRVVRRIPKGRVATYGQVAGLAGLPGYARYVGTVLSKLPTGTKLPWHRVINSKGQISFPQGSEQYREQKNRLEQEGVVFLNGRVSFRKYVLGILSVICELAA